MKNLTKISVENYLRPQFFELLEHNPLIDKVVDVEIKDFRTYFVFKNLNEEQEDSVEELKLELV